MDFNSLNSETKDLLRPLIKRIILSMEGVVSDNESLALENCSASDNIEAISIYIRSLKSDGCKFNNIQNIDESDIFVFSNNNVDFDIDIYFNGRQDNSGFFAVFSARIDTSGDFLIFETIKT